MDSIWTECRVYPAFFNSLLGIEDRLDFVVQAAMERQVFIPVRTHLYERGGSIAGRCLIGLGKILGRVGNMMVQTKLAGRSFKVHAMRCAEVGFEYVRAFSHRQKMKNATPIVVNHHHDDRVSTLSKDGQRIQVMK